MEKRYPKNIMATVCLPWTADYNFDENHFRKSINILCVNGIKSIYLFGTAGEGYLPNSEEFLRIALIFKSETDKYIGTLPMLGIISNSIQECIDRIDCAAKHGFMDFQISFPSWGVVNDSEAFTFMRTICRRFPNLRFMHYNNGIRSGKKLTAKQYIQLCEELPNLVAIKHTGATLREVAQLMSANLPLQVFFLEDAYAYGSLLGECSLLISILNTNYAKAKEYFDAGDTKDSAALVQAQKEITTFYEVLNLLPSTKMDGAYDKLFVRYSLPEYPIRLYPPYEGITDFEWVKFDTALRLSLPKWTKTKE